MQQAILINVANVCASFLLESLYKTETNNQTKEKNNDLQVKAPKTF